MEILTAILIGLLVGVVAKLLMPGRDPGGWIVTILLGMGGSMLAGYFGRFMGWYENGATAGFVASVLGAIFILMIYRLLVRNAHRR